MIAMFRQAQTVALLLGALTCFLTGMAVAEGWSQTAPPLLPPTPLVITVEVGQRPTATPDFLPLPTLTPAPNRHVPPNVGDLPPRPLAPGRSGGRPGAR
jgi:hypothetical protein